MIQIHLKRAPGGKFIITIEGPIAPIEQYVNSIIGEAIAKLMPMPAAKEAEYTVKEAAAQLKRSEKQVRRYLKSARLGCDMRGSRPVIKQHHLDAFDRPRRNNGINF